MADINEGFVAQAQQLACHKAQFAATASLVDAAAQFVPPYNGAATALAAQAGLLCENGQMVINRMRCRFTGNAANAAQTITCQLLANGVALATLVITGIATTAGAQAGVVDLAPGAQILVAENTVLTCTITPSVILTAVVTNVMVSLS